MQVSYVDRGFGLSLGLSSAAADDRTDALGEGLDAVERSEGVLHISDAAVTLELVNPQGRKSVLAWDPAEVDWGSLNLDGPAIAA